MRNVAFAVSVFLAGSFASSVEAATTYSIQCESCQTDSQFRAKARDLESLNGGGGGNVYVYNLGANVVQKWYISPSSVGGGGMIPRAASQVAVTTTQLPVGDAVRIETQKAHNLYTTGGNSLGPIYNVPVVQLKLPAADGMSTYDVLRDNNLKGQIESKLGDIDVLNSMVSAKVLSSLMDVAQNATNILGLKQASFLLFRVVMSDGTWMDYRLNMSETTADAQDESARTPTGQLIPASPANVQGRWSGEAENLGPLVDHLAKLGVPVVDASPGTYVTEVVCASSKCTIRRIQR